jgi:DNA-binding transcriptional MerR regulator
VSTSAEGMLKMSELAERSGVSSGTIKHYLREGLLGDGDEIKRTSRNMAYYPEGFVERIRLIKRLQEDRFMPLRLIREVMADEPERAARMVESGRSRRGSPGASRAHACGKRMTCRRTS